jgi:hypothetical protein
MTKKHGYSDIEAEFILNTDLKDLGSDDYQLIRKRLMKYKKLLKDFLVEK